MIRKSQLIVLACLIPPSVVAAAELTARGEAQQSSGPAVLSNCSGVWCSTVVPGIAAMAATAFSKGGVAQGIVAQGKDLGLVVEPVTLAEPATQARLQVHIGSSDPLPKNTLIRLRGLPPAVSVPQGHVVAAGAWAVPVYALAELSLVVPSGLVGWSDVSVALVNTDGVVLAQSRTKLVVAQPF